MKEYIFRPTTAI